MSAVSCCSRAVLSSSGASVWSECVASETPIDSSGGPSTTWIAITRMGRARVLSRTFGPSGEVHDVLDREFRRTTTWRRPPWRWDCGRLPRPPLTQEPLARFCWRPAQGNRGRYPRSRSSQGPGGADGKSACCAAPRAIRKVKIKIGPGKDVEWIAAIAAALQIRCRA